MMRQNDDGMLRLCYASKVHWRSCGVDESCSGAKTARTIFNWTSMLKK